MTRGLGDLLGLTEQWNFTFNLLPIYLGALPGLFFFCAGNITDNEQTGLLFSFEDYLQLVDYTGRIIRHDKRGAISDHIPPILERLCIEPQTWLANSTGFEKNYQKHFGRRKPNLANIA